MAVPTPSPDMLATILDSIHISGNARMFEVAAASVFVWDYFLTIGMEVDYVWPGPWTPIKVIYFIQRYLPFVDTVCMSLYLTVGANVPPETCTWLTNVGKSMTLVGLASCELILTFRVWAVWNRSKAMTFILPIIFCTFWLPHIPILYIFLKSLDYKPPPPPLFGCFSVTGSPISVWLWSLLAAWDALVLCLMLVPALKAYRFRGNSALFHTVYAEGILYYFYLFLMSLSNIILLRISTVDVAYRFILVSITRYLHSLLTSRALLHVRAGANRDAQREMEHVSSIEFVTYPRQ